LIAQGAAIVESVEDAERVLTSPRYPEPVVLDPIAAQIADAMRAGVIGVDALVAHTGLPVRTVLRALPLIEDSCIARKP
jgi:predicted Rossmann fold nucleotide-binding protein DprA/Smf involved in DNA uptake